jgi:beta-catenin-like protein 1
MTSMDELFKKPNLPLGSTKRKYDAPDAQQAYKAAKLSVNGSPNSTRTNGATVEDVGDDDDVEAGPTLPPDDENDDEEGRFFGGGVTEDTAEALDYIDQQDENGFKEESIDSAWLRRLSVSFEKKVNKNAELRARYENEPQKFMASEADLDAEIKSWSLLSEHPELYKEFAESESVGHLVGLLAHENTDIAIGAVEIISELLDEDVEAEQEQWGALVTALLDADLMELLMSNLERLDEENESDRSGVYHSFAVIENLAGQESIAEKIGQEHILMFLCKRISKLEKQVSQNKQYAAEVLQVLLQTSTLLRRRLAVDIDGVDLFLRLLAPYRKRNPPSDSPEEEFAENVFDALTCVVDENDGKAKFVEAEGVELCLIMLKEGSFSKIRALRLLDHAVGGQASAAAEVCAKLVDAAGLKTIFGIFMKKKSDSSTIEHAVGILSALLRLLPGESSARIRLLAKFQEKGYEKVHRLVQLRKDYDRKVAAIDEEMKLEQRMLDDEEREERSDEFFSRRLDGGLFSLQTIDAILAWLVAEDINLKVEVDNQLGGLQAIRDGLQEQLASLESTAANDDDTRDMLTTLVEFLT